MHCSTAPAAAGTNSLRVLLCKAKGAGAGASTFSLVQRIHGLAGPTTSLEIPPVVLSSVLQPPKVESRPGPLPVAQLLDTTWVVSDPTCIKLMRQMLLEIVGHRLEDVQRV